TGDLSHFFTYDLPELTVEQVGTYCDALTGLSRLYFQHLGLDVRTIEGEVPGEVGSFHRDNVNQEFDTARSAFTTVDPCVDKTRGIRDLCCHNLIFGGLFVYGGINCKPVVEHAQFETNLSLRGTHRFQFVVGYGRTRDSPQDRKSTRLNSSH